MLHSVSTQVPRVLPLAVQSQPLHQHHPGVHHVLVGHAGRRGSAELELAAQSGECVAALMCARTRKYSIAPDCRAGAELFRLLLHHHLHVRAAAEADLVRFRAARRLLLSVRLQSARSARGVRVADLDRLQVRWSESARASASAIGVSGQPD